MIFHSIDSSCIYQDRKVYANACLYRSCSAQTDNYNRVNAHNVGYRDHTVWGARKQAAQQGSGPKFPLIPRAIMGRHNSDENKLRQSERHLASSLLVQMWLGLRGQSKGNEGHYSFEGITQSPMHTPMTWHFQSPSPSKYLAIPESPKAEENSEPISLPGCVSTNTCTTGSVNPTIIANRYAYPWIPQSNNYSNHPFRLTWFSTVLTQVAYQDRKVYTTASLSI